jgi:hypothetical protein
MTGLITDPEFDSNLTKQYKLSIQVSLDGFSFSVTCEKQKKLLALESIPVTLSSGKFLGRRFNEWVLNNEILRKNYNRTSIIYYSENFTFIPSEYYDYSKQKNLGNLVLENPESNPYIDNYMPNAKGNLVFPVSSGFAETAEATFPGTSLLHPVTILDAELLKLADLKANLLVLYFGRKSFSLLIYSGHKLKAINHFSYVSPGDVAFFTLSVLNKLKLSPEKTTLYMAGKINPKDHIHISLNKLFNRTVFFIPDIQYNSEVFKDPLHKYITLF